MTLLTLRTHKVPLHRARGNETLLLLLRLSLAPARPLSPAHAHLCARSVGPFHVRAGTPQASGLSPPLCPRAPGAARTHRTARLLPHRRKAPLRRQEVQWKAAQASFRDKHQREGPHCHHAEADNLPPVHRPRALRRPGPGELSEIRTSVIPEGKLTS